MEEALEAIILVGGLGTRLKSAVPFLPKCMAPVQGRPFLSYLLDYLISQGIRKVYLSVYYKHEVIFEYFKNNYNGLIVDYIIDSLPLQTGGAIKHALTEINTSNLFVINGDTFVQVNYKRMWALYSQESLVIALHKVEDCFRYGSVIVQGGVVQQFVEKCHEGPGLINAGVYLLNREHCLYHMAKEVFSFEQDFLPDVLPLLQPRAFIIDGYFKDVGIPPDYRQFELDITQGIVSID